MTRPRHDPPARKPSDRRAGSRESHTFRFRKIQMNRQNALFVFQAIVVLLLLAISDTISAVQSPAPQQQQKSTQSKDPDSEEINPDRPGIADGSTVIGAKSFQIESGIQVEFRREVNRERTLFIPTLLRIGISNHFEGRIEGNTFTRKSDSDPTGMSNSVSGLAPLSFGLKYQIQDSNGVSHPSVGAIIRVFPAWGTSDFRTHHVTGDLRLAADWDFAPRLKLSLNPNVGIGVYEDDKGKGFAAGLFAMTLNYLPTKKLNPFIDIGIQAPEEKGGKTSLIMDEGVAYIVGHNIELDVSVGAGARGHTPAHPFVSFGLSLRGNGFRHKK